MADEAAAKKLWGFEFDEVLHESGRRIALLKCKTCDTTFAVPDGERAKQLTVLIVSIHNH